MQFFRYITFERVVFVGLFLFLSVHAALYDPDYFWHLRAGQYIVEHAALPTHDIFFLYPDRQALGFTRMAF